MGRRIGAIKVKKVMHEGRYVWGIHGRNQQYPDWTLCYEENFGWLTFDLEYDACAYMVGFEEWRDEQRLKANLNNTASPFKSSGIKTIESRINNRLKRRRKRNKAARKARKRNRK
jgi:hypothetical protein